MKIGTGNYNVNHVNHVHEPMDMHDKKLLIIGPNNIKNSRNRRPYSDNYFKMMTTIIIGISLITIIVIIIIIVIIMAKLVWQVIMTMNMVMF